MTIFFFSILVRIIIVFTITFYSFKCTKANSSSPIANYGDGYYESANCTSNHSLLYSVFSKVHADDGGMYEKLIVDCSLVKTETGEYVLYAQPNVTPDAIPFSLTVDQLSTLILWDTLLYNTMLCGGLLFGGIVGYIIFKLTTKKPVELSEAPLSYKVISFFAVYMPFLFLLAFISNLTLLLNLLVHPGTLEVLKMVEDFNRTLLLLS